MRKVNYVSDYGFATTSYDEAQAYKEATRVILEEVDPSMTEEKGAWLKNHAEKIRKKLGIE